MTAFVPALRRRSVRGAAVLLAVLVGGGILSAPAAGAAEASATASIPPDVPRAHIAKFHLINPNAPVVDDSTYYFWRDTLTAEITEPWGPAPVKYSWQWYRGTHKIAHATHQTYRAVLKDIGEYLRVELTGSKKGYASKSLYSNYSKFILPRPYTKSDYPYISGSLVQGSKLTVIHGVYVPTPTSWTYRWYRDGVKIPKATHTTYMQTAADVGHVINVRADPHRVGYQPAAWDTNNTTPTTGFIG